MNTSAGPVPAGGASPFRVAVVGAGPTGCYTAQALRKGQPDIEITVFDSVPAPYGLVRYGIAPDHQGAKSVQRQFERLFAQSGVEFVGNVSIGSDVPLGELLANFHAVVLATGLGADNRLPVHQDPDARIVGAGELIRLLNSHPDARLRGQTAPLGDEVVILGTGNVAVDVARLLSKSDRDFAASDVDDQALRSLTPAPVKTIHILGRCEPHLAKWDASMVRELAQVAGVRVSVDGVPLLGEAPEPARTTVNVRFRRVPVAIREHEGRVRVTTHRAGDPGQVEHLDADTVITAVGFGADPAREVPCDGHGGGNLFRVGGPATGRLGNLAENRKLAFAAAKGILETLRAQQWHERAGLAGIGDRLPFPTVSFQGWRRIDEAEVRRARPGRCRTKFTTRDELLAAAGRSPAGLEAVPPTATAARES